jgi:hypothetical protein
MISQNTANEGPEFLAGKFGVDFVLRLPLAFR